MKLDRTCQYCRTTFDNIDGKVFANHVRWCNKNLTNGDKGSAKIVEAANLRRLSIKGEKSEFTVVCNKCNTQFVVYEYNKLHPMRTVYHCSYSCSNNRGPRSENTKRAISAKLTLPPKNMMCMFCKEYFSTTRNQKYCSRSCGKKSRVKCDPESIKRYRQLCKFDFSLNDFPSEFDFSLVEKHGWYSVSKKKYNVTGVSRDHMVSVVNGYKNNVDPKIIAHPANCRLLVHGENISKGSKCSISLDELLHRINVWEEKFSGK